MQPTREQVGSPVGAQLGADGRALRWPSGWMPVLIFAAGMLALRLVFMAGFDPFTLIEDEAHYWEWSRRLGLSYYSKGPGVAWAIAAATWLFGDVEWAVRLPAMLSVTIGSIAAAGLTKDIFGDRRLMIAAAALYQAMPGPFMTGLLMTIDGPYIACWALAAWAGWRALARGSKWAWPMLGVVLALGFMFKYTILILPVGLVLFAVVRRKHLRIAGPGWVALGAGCSLLGLVPIAIWNSQHDWATVRHLLGHLGVAGGDMQAEAAWSYDPMATLEFFGLQFAVAGTVFALVVLGVINLVRARRAGRQEWMPAGPAFLICCALPLFGMYLLVTLLTRVEANWTMAAFTTLVPIAGWAAADGIVRFDRPMRFVWHMSLAVFGIMIVAAPVLAWFVRTDDAPAWMGRAKPITRYIDEVSAIADEMRAQTGEDPVFIAIHYGRASQLAFYLPGQPTVYAASAHFGLGRRTQYDVWAETDLANPDVGDLLRGRDAVLFDGGAADWQRMFERVEDLGVLEHEPKKGRPTLKGFGFIGVPEERTK